MLALALVLSASACATTGGDPRDPLETMNRGVLAFNDAADAALLTPAARAYRAVLPEGLRGMVRNFFTNLDDVWIGVNNLLQGKPADAAGDGLRFVFNSTLGFFGLIDLASEVGLEKHNEDLGQTLGRDDPGDRLGQPAEHLALGLLEADLGLLDGELRGAVIVPALHGDERDAQAQIRAQVPARVRHLTDGSGLKDVGSRAGEHVEVGVHGAGQGGQRTRQRLTSLSARCFSVASCSGV